MRRDELRRQRAEALAKRMAAKVRTNKTSKELYKEAKLKKYREIFIRVIFTIFSKFICTIKNFNF